MRVRAKRCEYDGYKFDSIAERDRYIYLGSCQRDGDISGLTVHPRFEFVVNGIKIGRGYKPDFQYRAATGLICVEDVKGWKRIPAKLSKRGKLIPERHVPRTDKGFKMRADLMRALFGIEVTIV